MLIKNYSERIDADGILLYIENNFKVPEKPAPIISQPAIQPNNSPHAYNLAKPVIQAQRVNHAQPIKLAYPVPKAQSTNQTHPSNYLKPIHYSLPNASNQMQIVPYLDQSNLQMEETSQLHHSNRTLK